MDLGLFLRVLWRFRVLVLVGFVLAAGLAILSFARVSFDGGRPELTYREKEQWASYARLLVTQPGFDWGTSVVQLERSRLPADEAARLGLQEAAESRLASLAIFYSRLLDSEDERQVDSDALRAILLRDGPLRGSIEAAPLPAREGSEEIVPIISIVGLAETPSASLQSAQRAMAALREYVADQQQRAGVTASNRVVLEPLQQAGGTKLFDGRSRTLPIVVFVTVMIAVLGLAFILENLRPRIRAVSRPEAALGPTASIGRRSTAG